MRVLLTGATGFVGSYVLERIVQDPQMHVAITLRATSNPWRIRKVMGRVRLLEANLNDVAAVRRALAEHRPDTVVHLAWDGVENRFRNDEGQIDNVGQSLGLLRLAREAGAGHFVGLGSQAEYGPCQGAIDEEAPTRPTTLYGAAKLSTCILAQQFCELNGMRFAWLRLFAVYGPKEDPEWLIPYVVLRLLRGERPALTEGRQLCDYLHVADAAEATCLVAQTPAAAGVFNLGSGQAESVRRIVERIRDQIDPSLPLVFGAVPYRADQLMHLQARIERLQHVTGWRPRVALDAGIRGTVTWYRLEAARESAHQEG